jgi:hypothetical protein
MNIGKIWQKAKDLYGWDQGNLFWFKDKREFHRKRIEALKTRIDSANNKSDYNKWSYHLQNEQAEFDRCDDYVREHGEEFDTNIGYRRERRG